MTPDFRERAKRRLARYFEQTGFPRLLMSAIVLITGAAGFLASWGMLHAGVDRMAWRYPLAVAAAYVVFLGLVRAWAELERRRFHPAKCDLEDSDEKPPIQTATGLQKTTSRWWDILDVADFPGVDLDEGCAVVLFFGLVITLGGVVLAVVINAPVLIAEVFLDAVLVSILYRRLKSAAQTHWLGTALRQTWIPALIAAVALGATGAILQAAYPKARSIGYIFRDR